VDPKFSRILGYAIFFVGAILGFALSITLIWNRMEAVNYYFSGIKYEPFQGLQCPAMIAPRETGVVNIVFDNQRDRDDTFFYRAEISGDVFTRQVEDQLLVPARETRSIQLTVDANDVDLRFFIFVKMNILPSASRPAQEAVCGIVVADILGLTGAQVSTMTTVLSFLGMAVGLGLWQRANPGTDPKMARAMQILGFLVLLTMLAGAMGWWLPGIALAVITILFLVISLRFTAA
jgi:hypothetical protein